MKICLCGQFKDLWANGLLGWMLQRVKRSQTVLRDRWRHCLFWSFPGIYWHWETYRISKKDNKQHHCKKELNKNQALVSSFTCLWLELLTQCCHHVVISDRSTLICSDDPTIHQRLKLKSLASFFFSSLILWNTKKTNKQIMLNIKERTDCWSDGEVKWQSITYWLKHRRCRRDEVQLLHLSWPQALKPVAGI